MALSPYGACRPSRARWRGGRARARGCPRAARAPRSGGRRAGARARRRCACGSSGRRRCGAWRRARAAGRGEVERHAVGRFAAGRFDLRRQAAVAGRVPLGRRPEAWARRRRPAARSAPPRRRWRRYWAIPRFGGGRNPPKRTFTTPSCSSKTHRKTDSEPRHEPGADGPPCRRAAFPSLPPRGRLAQSGRAPALQAGGRPFEPGTAHFPLSLANQAFLALAHWPDSVAALSTE